MFKDILDNITKLASDGRFEAHAREAYKEFERRAGMIYTDDISYEAKMTSFLEWFAFTRPVTAAGETILDLYRVEQARGSDLELALVDALKTSLHDVFLVKSSSAGVVKATALYRNENLYLYEDERAAMLRKGDLFEGRAAEYDKRWYLTNGFCHHPSSAAKFIKAEMKRLRKAGLSADDFMFQLAGMSSRWERSRQIEVGQIYKAAG